MAFSVPLLIPLACAFLYVLAALALKRAAGLGVGVWRSNFVANWVILAIFAPAWFLAPSTDALPGPWWQPVCAGLAFLGGQTLIFMAISRGDVSVTTPVMGSKVILVALLASLLRVGDVPLKWWIGAGLSAAAVALLHAGERSGGRTRHLGPTVALTLASALSYSLGDVMMQKWVPAWGAARFFPVMFLSVALLSFAFVPFFTAPLWRLEARAWRWVLLGAGLMGLNNAGIVIAIGQGGGATAVNIVYSLRGLVSVVLVWAIGHWFANEEKHLAPGVLRARLVGAALMLAAVALVLL